MARILAVGIATLDIINQVDVYPPEDSEVRALAQRRVRGGNATNSLVVLSQLGHDCAWAGVLVDEPDAAPILAELDRYRIDYSHCRRLARGKMPTSYILHSRATGSRSIVHYRDLPEYDLEHFRRIDLETFDWVHFEGRNPEETEGMLRHLRTQRPDLAVSIEIEKPRPGIERLFPHADLLLFARDYAWAQGYADAAALLRGVAAQAPERDLVCAWGEAGAWALDRDGGEHHSPAFVPPRLVDTLGAGDTFNAAVIDARLHGEDWSASLTRACRVAGAKCGREGLHGVNCDD
ncbi:PfkB family carbohydrate kinase [Thiohalobacter thiocyanaticus]|uniref:Ketohexokinase n=1 Tax=Thiohalobacter thiocyanaticus TaxID=585455 RepID=A0A426QKH0_9GAMM|nr:PfkB family carbohydrate kinase [Thiohalobacter thiocyanaticus]RRQ22263.1 ketohexokinase [Thiohalobacter thiocyanaticus]